MLKIKKACLIFPLSLLILNLYSQDWAKIDQLTYDAEYFFMTRQYDKAINSYSQILKQLPSNANIIYKIGVCYLLTEKDKEKSIPYFEEATKKINKYYRQDSFKEYGAPPETYFLLGSAYRVNNELDKAINAYNEYLKILEPKQTKEKQITEHYIESCNNASAMMNSPVNVIETSLGKPLNDDLPNFNAVFSADGNTVVFNTSKKDIISIMMSTRTNGIWAKPKAIGKQITSKNNFKVTGISADGKTLCLVEDDPFNSEIYISKFNKGRWSGGEKLKKPVNSKMNESHASFSPDGNTIYFTSDRPGGLGDFDIYYSRLDEKGKWGKPENMGPKINTIFNEETPFISPDGKRLYFSSEGHKGMGGQDIYYFDLQTGEGPVNLGYPVNTTDNDIFFFPAENTGYYSRVEKNEFASRDIYEIKIQSQVEIKGLVTSNNPQNSDFFNITLINSNDFSTVAELTASKENNSFSKKVSPGNYLLTVTAAGYENFSKEIKIDETSGNEYYMEAQMRYIEPEPVAEIVSVENPIETVPEKTEIVAEVVKETYVEPVKEEPVVKTVLKDDIKPVVKTTSYSKPASEKTSVVRTVPGKKNVVISLTPLQPFIDEVVNEINDVSSISPGTPVTYTLQLYALRNPVDLSNIKNIKNINLHYAADYYFKYTWGKAFTIEEAKKLREELKAKGFNNVIIRRRAIVPAYTIQVMAGGYLDYGYFNKFDRLKITLGNDGIYRYTYGEFASFEEAEKELKKLKSKGYQKAFIKKL